MVGTHVNQQAKQPSVLLDRRCISSPGCVTPVIVATGSRFGFPGSYGKTTNRASPPPSSFLPSTSFRIVSRFLSRQGSSSTTRDYPLFPLGRPRSFSLEEARFSRSLRSSSSSAPPPPRHQSPSFLRAANTAASSYYLSFASSHAAHVRFVFVFPASSILSCPLFPPPSISLSFSLFERERELSLEVSLTRTRATRSLLFWLRIGEIKSGEK